MEIGGRPRLHYCPQELLLRLAASLFAIAFSGQRLLDAQFLPGFQVKRVPLDLPDNVLLQHFPLKSLERVLERLAFLQPYFSQIAPAFSIDFNIVILYSITVSWQKSLAPLIWGVIGGKIFSRRDAEELEKINASRSPEAVKEFRGTALAYARGSDSFRKPRNYRHSGETIRAANVKERCSDGLFHSFSPPGSLESSLRSLRLCANSPSR